MKKLICISVFLFFVWSLSAQMLFQHTYGFGPVNTGKCIRQFSDSNYVICGSASSYGSTENDVYVFKISQLGNEIFHRTYGGAQIDVANSLLETPTKQILIAGFTNSSSTINDYDGYIILLDSSGNLIWNKPFGTSEWDFINDVKATGDGNYLAAGYSYGSGTGIASGWLLKFDITGNVIWDKFIPFNQQLILNKIQFRSNGDFFVCGNTTSTLTSTNDAFIALMNSSGDSLWTQNFDNGGSETFNAMDLFSNGDVLVGGSKTDTTTNYKNEAFFRYDTLGNQVFSSIANFPGQSEVTSVIVENDTCLISGTTANTGIGAGGADFHFSKFNSNGTFFYYGASYGAIGNEVNYDAVKTLDTGYIMVGSTNTFTPGLQSVFVVKTNHLLASAATTVIKVDELNAEHSQFFYPNPADRFIKFYNSANTEVGKLSIVNLAGKIIKSVDDFFISALDLSDIANGIYFLKISYKTGANSVQKLIVAHQ